MENKPTVEELLRQQLQLLAERSANEASVEQLPQLTLAMVEICNLLKHYRVAKFDMQEIIESFANQAEELVSKLADINVNSVGGSYA